MRAARIVVPVLLAILTVSCSSQPPQFGEVRLRLIASLDAQTGAISERLSLFARVTDADGEGEIARLAARMPQWGIGWTLEPPALLQVRSEGRLWYGSDQLIAPGWGRLPRGPLELEVTDLSGRSDTRTVTLSAPAGEYLAETFISFEDGVADIPPGRDRIFIVLLRGDGSRETREIERDERLRRVVRLSQLRTGDEALWMIRAMSETLWLESGPW